MKEGYSIAACELFSRRVVAALPPPSSSSSLLHLEFRRYPPPLVEHARDHPARRSQVERDIFWGLKLVSLKVYHHSPGSASELPHQVFPGQALSLIGREASKSSYL